MKTFEIEGVELVFWSENDMLYFREHDMGTEIYCCGSAAMPETAEEVLKITETAWVW